jgi:protein pelota
MIDNLDDLWHLYNIIEKGDIVASRSFRRLEKVDDKIRPDKTPKKLIWLAVEVEDVEFHEFSNRLRVHGIISKGPDDIGLKSYHTFNFSPNDTMELEKPQPWRKHQSELLKTAVFTAKQPLVTIVALEDDNAVIAQLYQYGIRNITTIERTGTGKLYSGSGTSKSDRSDSSKLKNDFFKNILTQLNQVRSGDTPLIFVGPGFTKDEFLKFCKQNQVSGSNQIILEPTGQSGMVGIQEAIKRGVVKRVAEDSRLSYETELVDKLLEGIAISGPITYGTDETKTAVGLGAVDTLLVIDKLIRQKNELIEKIMNDTESQGGMVVVISTVHDAGKQLESLGGIAGLLRYKI